MHIIIVVRVSFLVLSIVTLRITSSTSALLLFLTLLGLGSNLSLLVKVSLQLRSNLSVILSLKGLVAIFSQLLGDFRVVGLEIRHTGLLVDVRQLLNLSRVLLDLFILLGISVAILCFVGFAFVPVRYSVLLLVTWR